MGMKFRDNLVSKYFKINYEFLVTLFQNLRIGELVEIFLETVFPIFTPWLIRPVGYCNHQCISSVPLSVCLSVYPSTLSHQSIGRER